MAPPSQAIGEPDGLVWLHDDAARSIDVAGGKAGRLAELLAAGFAVPDGLVVTIGHAGDHRLGTAIVDRLGPGPLAVRSSAAGEDGQTDSWAGMFETVLGASGGLEVAHAINVVSASTQGPQARGYGDATVGMAILVQPMIEARLAGVAFASATPLPGTARVTVVTAVEGLADGLVAGRVAGDEWSVRDGLAIPPAKPSCSATVDDIAAVATLAESVADHLGVAQDIEWAIDADQLWLLQARPLTAPFPVQGRSDRVGDEVTLVGIAASSGRATGPARIVRDMADLDRVRAGDVLVAPSTSPAWTPVFAEVAAVVTDVGSAAAHAAIVAREFGIPAVTDTGDASSRLRDGWLVTVDGDAGTVHIDTKGW